MRAQKSNPMATTRVKDPAADTGVFATLARVPATIAADVAGVPGDVMSLADTAGRYVSRKALGGRRWSGAPAPGSPEEQANTFTPKYPGTDAEVNFTGQGIADTANASSRALGGPDVALGSDTPVPADMKLITNALRIFGSGVASGEAGLQGARRLINPATVKPGSFAEKLSKTARENPKLYRSAQIAGATGAAAGSTVAQTVAPDNPYVDAIAQVSGGLLYPPSLAITAATTLRNARVARPGLDKALNWLTPAATKGGVEKKAAKILQDEIERTGGNVGDVRTAIGVAAKDPDLKGFSTADVTGNEALLNLEAKLGANDGAVGSALEKQRRAAFKAVETNLAAETAKGKPLDLKKAVGDFRNYFRNSVMSRTKQAELEARQSMTAADKATEAVDKAKQAAKTAGGEISYGGNRAQIAASEKIVAAHDAARSDARDIVNAAYDAVDLNVPTNAPRVKAALEIIRKERLSTDPLKHVIEQWFKNQRPETGAGHTILDGASGEELFKKPAVQTTATELKNLRTHLMEDAFQAKIALSPTDQRAYTILAKAAMEDLADLNIPGLETATAKARACHEVFNETFAQKLQAETRTGADALPPGAAGRAMFGGGDAGAEARFREVITAAGHPETTGGMLGAQAKAAAADWLDAEAGLMRKADGSFDANAVNKWMTKNNALLENYPDLRGNLQAVLETEMGIPKAADALKAASVKATEAGDALKARQAVVNSSLDKGEKVFQSVLGVDDPAKAVGAALKSKNAADQYRRLAGAAKRGTSVGSLGKGGPSLAARDGLYSATIGHVIEDAADASGAISWVKINERLNKGGVLDLMTKNGVIDGKTRAWWQQIAGKMARIEGAARDKSAMGSVLQGGDAVLERIMAVGGAKVGGTVSKAIGGGAGLQPTSMGASTGRTAAALPSKRITRLLVQAAKDPEVAAELLKKSPDAKRGMAVLHGFLINAGAINPDEKRN